MSIIHSYNLNKGTLLDRFGNTTTNTGSVFKKHDKGLSLYFDGINDKFELGSLGNIKAIAFWLKLQTTTEQIFEGDPNAHLIHANSGTLTYPDFDNAYIDNIDSNTIDIGWHCVIVTSTTNVACTDAVVALNNAAYGNLYCAKVIVYDAELTAKERADLQRDFIHAVPLGKTLRPDYTVLKPTDLSNEPNIIAAYNMVPNGTVLVDTSGNDGNGAITGAISSRDGMVFDGKDDSVRLFIPIGPAVTVKTVAFRIKLDSTTEKILQGQTNDILIHANAGTLTYADYDNAFINGVDTNAITAGNWVNVVITSTTAVDNNTATLGLNDTTYGKFEMEDLKFYSDEKDLAWAKAYHNSFASRISMLENFDYDGVSNVPKEWIPGTGTYSVQELAAQDGVLKHLDVGTPYLECTSSGTMAIPSKRAYGTWEFDLYKGGDVSIPRIHFIDNTVFSRSDWYENAYRFMLDSDEGVYLSERTGSYLTKLASAASYITINTWYRIKITRTLNGEFTVYIRGGAFGDNDWTLVSVIGGSGANPVIDVNTINSMYFIVDLDTDDRIANIKITEGVIQ